MLTGDGCMVTHNYHYIVEGGGEVVGQERERYRCLTAVECERKLVCVCGGVCVFV